MLVVIDVTIQLLLVAKIAFWTAVLGLAAIVIKVIASVIEIVGS